MKTTTLLLALAALSASPAAGQDSTYFGLTFGQHEANPFMGWYAGGSFHRHQPDRSGGWEAVRHRYLAWAMRMPLDTPLAAVDSGGGTGSVVVDSVMEPFGDLYEMLYGVTTRGVAGDYVLFFTPGVSVRPVSMETAQLDTATSRMARRLADSLVQAAAIYRLPDERPDSSRVGEPTAVAPRGGSTWWIRVPVAVLRGQRSDDRGAAYIVRDRTSGRVLHATFGHGEWSPEATDVQRFEPLMFFRIDGDARLYAVVDVSGAWEDLSLAIVDAGTGEVLMETY